MKINEQLNNIVLECRDIEEMSRVVRAYDLAKKEMEKKMDSIWIIKAKIDRVYDELIDKKYGD